MGFVKNQPFFLLFPLPQSRNRTMTKAHAIIFGIMAMKPHKSIAKIVPRTKPKMITTIHQGLVIFNLYI